MRAPFQVLAIPYKIVDSSIQYCVFHRSDLDQWQFIAGGGEDDESLVQAVKREISEESGIAVDKIMELTSLYSYKYLSKTLFRQLAERYVCCA